MLCPTLVETITYTSWAGMTPSAGSRDPYPAAPSQPGTNAPEGDSTAFIRIKHIKSPSEHQLRSAGVGSNVATLKSVVSSIAVPDAVQKPMHEHHHVDGTFKDNRTFDRPGHCDDTFCLFPNV